MCCAGRPLTVPGAGVWDVLSNEAACKAAREGGATVESGARCLARSSSHRTTQAVVNGAYTAGSTDNISAIVARL